AHDRPRPARVLIPGDHLLDPARAAHVRLADRPHAVGRRSRVRRLPDTREPVLPSARVRESGEHRRPWRRHLRFGHVGDGRPLDEGEALFAHLEPHRRPRLLVRTADATNGAGGRQGNHAADPYMEDRLTPELYLETTDLPIERYAAERVPAVLALRGV